MKDDATVDVKFVNFFGNEWKDWVSDWVRLKISCPNESYVLERMMELQGDRFDDPYKLINHEVQVVLVGKSVVAIKGVNNNEFFLMPSSKVYCNSHTKIKYTKEELEKIFDQSN